MARSKKIKVEEEPEEIVAVKSTAPVPEKAPTVLTDDEFDSLWIDFNRKGAEGNIEVSRKALEHLFIDYNLDPNMAGLVIPDDRRANSKRVLVNRDRLFQILKVCT